MLDINLFREEKGGRPDVVRESQRRRGARVEIVDEIIAEDKQWVKGIGLTLIFTQNTVADFGHIPI